MAELEGAASGYITPKFTVEFEGTQANVCKLPRYQAAALLNTTVQFPDLDPGPLELQVLNAQCFCSRPNSYTVSCTPRADLEWRDSSDIVVARQTYTGTTGGKVCLVGSPPKPRECLPELDAEVRKNCEDTSFGVLRAFEQQSFFHRSTN